MNKLDMAHEMALAIQGTKLIHDMELVSDMAWKYADAMQAEDDKRNNKETCDKNIGLDSSVLKPSNSMELEWQPDWSQAPDNAEGWCMYEDGMFAWLYNAKYMDSSALIYSCEAPSFNYQGNWQESLRKRPQ